MIKKNQSDIKRPFSGPALTIMSINIEGISPNKEEILAELCRAHSCDVICLKEIHRDKDMKTPRINGMKLAALRPHRKYDSAIFVKPNIQVTSSETTETNDIKVLTVDLGKYSVTSVYKPPSSTFVLNQPKNFNNHKIKIMVGDFNCHS